MFTVVYWLGWNAIQPVKEQSNFLETLFKNNDAFSIEMNIEP